MQVFIIFLLTGLWITFSIYNKRERKKMLQKFVSFSKTLETTHIVRIDDLLTSIQNNLKKIQQKKSGFELEDLISIGEINIYTKTTYNQYLNPKSMKILYLSQDPIVLAEGISIEKEDLQKLLLEKTKKMIDQRSSFLKVMHSQEFLFENKLKNANR